MTGKIRVMFEFDESERKRVALVIRERRVDKGWSKEAAAAHAQISSITWKKAEDGKVVQDLKLRAIEIALGLGAGSFDRAAKGREIVVEDRDDIEQIRARGFADFNDRAIWDGFRAANQFATDCQARGANPKLVNDFMSDAVVLLSEVGRIRAHPEDSELRLAGEQTLSAVDDTMATAALETEDGLDESPGGSDPDVE